MLNKRLEEGTIRIKDGYYVEWCKPDGVTRTSYPREQIIGTVGKEEELENWLEETLMNKNVARNLMLSMFNQLSNEDIWLELITKDSVKQHHPKSIEEVEQKLNDPSYIHVSLCVSNLSIEFAKV